PRPAGPSAVPAGPAGRSAGTAGQPSGPQPRSESPFSPMSYMAKTPDLQARVVNTGGSLISIQRTGRAVCQAGGRGVGQAEHQGQVQRVRPRGQRFVEHPVTADALDADAVALQVPVEVALADRLVSGKSGLAARRPAGPDA